MSRPHNYWWDFVWRDGKIAGVEIVAFFPDSPQAVERAEKLIEDLRAGRADPRRCG